MDDTFRGDDAHLVRSIEAHLALDAAGALVPHGVGGLARVLLASAAARLSAALARSGQAASGSSQGARSDERTGWPPGLLQDDSRELSRALASKPDAMVHARDAAAKIGQPEAPTAAPLEPVAHMFPSDLEKFKTNETWAQAFSVAVGSPDERTVPLYAHPPARSGAAPKSDHCPEKLKPGGCQLHNLHCGYPKCNEPPAARSGAGSEDAERAARAPFEARYPSKILWKRGGSVFAEDVPGAEYVDQGVQRDWELWLEAWSAAVAMAGSEEGQG